jgi:hypothetical protein
LFLKHFVLFFRVNKVFQAGKVMWVTLVFKVPQVPVGPQEKRASREKR